MEQRELLARIRELGGLPSPEEADRWAMTVLLALIHLLPDRHKRRRLITQLPGTVKARLLAEPPGALSMDLDAFLQHVAAALGVHAPEGARAARVVYTAPREAVSPGEMANVEADLPKGIVGFLTPAA
jgi:uncharacterized protein (DUF2267 family)